MNELSPYSSGLSALQAAQDRDFGSEGIPMVLALCRVSGVEPDVRDARARADGERIAATLDTVRADLFPSQRDGDLGCLISTLQATSLIVGTR